VVCIDPQCAVTMIACAWSPENKDGSKYLRTPILELTPITSINPSTSVHGDRNSARRVRQQGIGAAERPTKRATDPRSLRKVSPNLLQASSLSSHVDDEEPEHGLSPPHEHTTRSILAACQCYVAYPKKLRWTRLHVDYCDGNWYRDVFVQLGTGDESSVGSTRILNSQIRVMTRIDLACNPLVLPLHYPDWKDTKKIR
jgi:hypothetical protein